MSIFKRMIGLCLCLVLLASFCPAPQQAQAAQTTVRAASFSGVTGPTLVKQNGIWYYVKNGTVCYDTTLVKFNGSWYYVKNGTTQPSMTTLVKFNGSWWYVVNGKVASNTTTLVKYNNEWWYVVNGKIASNTTSLVKYNGEWWYVVKGKIASNTTSLVKFNNEWWYVVKGKVASNTTTLVKFNGTWWYVAKGKIASNTTTFCSFAGQKYYVKNGTAQTNLSGKVTVGGKSYYIKNGVLTNCHSAGHSYRSATCTTSKTCTKCTYTASPALGHNWNGNVCTRCGLVKALMGMAVDTGTYTYYWQYDSQQYPSGAMVSNYSSNTAATLVRINRSGVKEDLFTANATKLVVTGNKLFYKSNGWIYSRNLDGSNACRLVSGTILDVEADGKYLIYSNDAACYSLNITTGISTKLFSDGNFEALYNGVVYYSVSVNSYSADRGTVILRAVNVDGTNDRLMVKTPADMSESYGSPYSIQKVHFGKQGVYFSYGNIAGTGQFYQGGKIVRVSYDGTDVQVMAGEEDLVSANFSIQEDGTVSEIADADTAFFDSQSNFYIANDTLYWMDPVSGADKPLLPTKRYSSHVSARVRSVNWLSVQGNYAIFMVDFSNLDPEQAVGWRDYAVRVRSIIYRLDINSGTLKQLYSF